MEYYGDNHREMAYPYPAYRGPANDYYPGPPYGGSPYFYPADGPSDRFSMTPGAYNGPNPYVPGYTSQFPGGPGAFFYGGSSSYNPGPFFGSNPYAYGNGMPFPMSPMGQNPYNGPMAAGPSAYSPNIDPFGFNSIANLMSSLSGGPNSALTNAGAYNPTQPNVGATSGFEGQGPAACYPGQCGSSMKGAL